MMLVILLVFPGEQGIHQMSGDALAENDLPFFVGEELGNQPAVAIIYFGRQHGAAVAATYTPLDVAAFGKQPSLHIGVPLSDQTASDRDRGAD